MILIELSQRGLLNVCSVIAEIYCSRGRGQKGGRMKIQIILLPMLLLGSFSEAKTQSGRRHRRSKRKSFFSKLSKRSNQMKNQLDALHEEMAEIRGSVEEIKQRLNKLSRESEPEYDSGSGYGGKRGSSDGRRSGKKRRNSKQKERIRKQKERGKHPKENEGEGLEAVFENLLPVGEHLLKVAASSAQHFLQSDLGRDILEVSKGAVKRMVLGLLKTIVKKAKGAVKNLAEGMLNDVLDGKGVVIDQLKTMIVESKGAVKKMATDIFDQVLTGKSGRKRKSGKKKRRQRHNSQI